MHMWNLAVQGIHQIHRDLVKLLPPLVTVSWLYRRLTGQVVLMSSPEKSRWRRLLSRTHAEVHTLWKSWVGVAPQCIECLCRINIILCKTKVLFASIITTLLNQVPVLCMPIKALTTNLVANLAWLGINLEIPLICPANRQKKMSLAIRIPSLIRFLLVKTWQKCATNCC